MHWLCTGKCYGADPWFLNWFQRSLEVLGDGSRVGDSVVRTSSHHCPPHPVGQQKYYLIDVLYMLDFQVEFLFNNEIQYWKQKIGNLCRRVREFNICISKWVAFWLMFLPSWASNRENPAPSSSLPPPPNGDQSLEERWAEVYASNWAPMLWALHTHTQRSYCLGLSSWRMFSVLAWAVESCWLMQARVRGGEEREPRGWAG